MFVKKKKKNVLTYRVNRIFCVILSRIILVHLITFRSTYGPGFYFAGSVLWHIEELLLSRDYASSASEDQHATVSVENRWSRHSVASAQFLEYQRNTKRVRNPRADSGNFDGPILKLNDIAVYNAIIYCLID